MTPAGWYDDPLTPGGKRFWDGAQWTDHAQAPHAGLPGAPGAPAPVAAPTNTPPPFAATPAGLPPAPGGQVAYTGSGINDLGDWIKRSFSMVFQRFGSLSAFFLVQFVVGAFAYLLLDQSLRGAAITDDGDFLGLNTGLIVLAGALFLVSALVSLFIHLSVHHSLYGGHVGQPPTTGQSFAAGLRSFPRFLGIVLLLYVAMLAAMAVLFGIGIGLGFLLGDSGGGLIVLLFVLSYIGFFVLSFWLSVKLAFITVGAVVIPPGTSVIRTSWNITKGIFWPILGRQLLLGMIVGMLFMVVYFVTYIAMIAVIFTRFGFAENGALTVDGQDIETLSIFEFSDFLPNPILMIVAFGVVSFLFYMLQAVTYSGATALYADLGGPNTFGHRKQQASSDW